MTDGFAAPGSGPDDEPTTPPSPGPTTPPPPGLGGSPPPPPPPPGPWAEPAPTLPKASWFRRLVAHLLDALIVTMFFVLAIVYLATGPTELRSCDVDADGNFTVFEEDAIGTGICEYPSDDTILLSIAIGLLGVIVFIGYSAYEGASGAMFGKRLLDLRVVDARSAQPIGAGRAVGRNLLRAVGWVIPFGYLVDHLWPLWDAEGRAVHDMAVTARVVPADAVPDVE